MLTFPVNRLAEFWATRGQLRKDYADMIKRSRCVKSGQSGDGAAAHATQFGIIWKAALYAGQGPATAKLFWDLWNKKQ